MALLAGTLYDPGTAVSKATTALLAMTAFDTTNLRLTFTAPSNGCVLVRVACGVTGSGTPGRYLLGVLDGATVRGRVYGMGGAGTINASGSVDTQEGVFVVSGLTPGNSYTWDAAYDVEATQASTNIKYGGPNDASGADAFGGFAFEIWDTANLLGSVLYDPSTLATLSTTSLLAMTAMDTTNARITFTAPSSGKIFWRIRVPYNGSTTYGQTLLGILDGATVKARIAPVAGLAYGSGASAPLVLDGSGLVTGLTPSNSYTWDAAYAVQVVSGAGGLKYGGPNNTTTNDAFGALCYEIWTA